MDLTLAGVKFKRVLAYGGFMRILVFAPSFAPAVDAGGPARSLTNLVASAAANHEVVVVTADRDLESGEAFPGLSGRRVTRGSATIYYLDLRSMVQWKSMIDVLRARDFDLILLNSLWHRTLAALPAGLCVLGILRGPVVVMPRGELEPGALSQGNRKKRLAGLLVRRLYGRAVFAVGTTSPSEAQAAAEWFPSISILQTTNSPDPIDFGLPGSSSDVLRVLTIGRVHPEKGLLPLLHGLRKAKGRLRLTAVGLLQVPGYWDECESAAKSLPANVEFICYGSASRDEIPTLLWNSDCMALLTAGENYGHVIAEALQAGCPVITTPATPWTNVLRDGGGDIIEDRDDPFEVAAVLDRWAAKAPEELSASRHRARDAYETFTAQAGPSIIELALKASPTTNIRGEWKHGEQH